MAEQRPEDHSDGGTTDAGFERELDDALAQAASLSNQLSAEVGAADGHPSVGATPSPNDGATALPHDLEGSLDTLDGLLAETGNELREPSDPPLSPLGKGGLQGVPIESSAVQSPRPGVVGTGKIGVVGTPPDLCVAGPPPQTSAPPSMREENGESDESHRAASDNAGVLIARVSPAIHALAEGAVRLLEVVDRPFAKLGATPRRWIGWVALATLGTSIVVFLLSVL